MVVGPLDGSTTTLYKYDERDGKQGDTEEREKMAGEELITEERQNLENLELRKITFFPDERKDFILSVLYSVGSGKSVKRL